MKWVSFWYNPRMRFFLPGLLFSSVLWAQVQLGRPNLLVGKAGGAGPPRLDAIGLNPALAGEMRTREIQGIWGYQSVDYRQRYPGFESHQSKSAGMEPTFPIPMFSTKFGSRFGISGIVIPIPVKQDIDVPELPLVILGQQNLVDLKGEGQLQGLADLNFGYRVAGNLSVGMNFSYQKIKADGRLDPSTATTGSVASFTLESQKLGLGLGVKYTLKRTFSFGLSSSIFRSANTDSDFNSSLLGSNGGDSGSSHSGSEILNPIRLAFGFKVVPKTWVLLDVVYERADRSEKRFSVVDFTEKDADVFDTMSFYLGSEIGGGPRWDYLCGYYNEPSGIGPGSAGSDGKAGFGFLDLAMNLGKPPERPVWGISFGARYSFKRVAKKAKLKEKRFQMATEFGLNYEETSIGIDESGEQPGAYLAKRTRVPLKFTYRF